MTTTVALLPMKLHSERVPGKNFRTFNGRPLFRWVLDTLLDMPEIDRVIINTDAREQLAAIGLRESERVVIRDRRPELCGDLVSMNLIIEDDISAVESDVYVMTHVTNPLIRASTIRSALQDFESAASSAEADSLFAVTRHQTRFYRRDGTPVNHDPSVLQRTQDLEPWFEENSNLYLFTRRSFASTNARIGARPLLFETPRADSVDIDDADTWTAAELMARARTATADTR
jgi:CMP-N-acetylneuraminic acid synthetase